MRSTLFAVIVTTIAGNAAAAEIMDGSGADLPSDIADQIVTSLLSLTTDPYSAQIIRVHRGANNKICAYVNLKNQSGGYVGFQPFYMSASSKKGQLQSTSGCK